MAKTEEPWRPETMPALLITRAAKLLGRIADTRLRELGASVSQLPVIVSLKNGERLTQKELARLTGVEYDPISVNANSHVAMLTDNSES